MKVGRRLVWHGMMLFVLGLLMGIVVPNVSNPRMGLSAHVGTVLNGVFVIAVGAVWSTVVLAPRWASATYWLVVLGSYVSCAGLFLAGAFGTSASTPLSGAGYRGTPWQEALVAAGLYAGGVALLIGCALLVWGLRPRAMESR